jgi:hypothetical protein
MELEKLLSGDDVSSRTQDIYRVRAQPQDMRYLFFTREEATIALRFFSQFFPGSELHSFVLREMDEDYGSGKGKGWRYGEHPTDTVLIKNFLGHAQGFSDQELGQKIGEWMNAKGEAKCFITEFSTKAAEIFFSHPESLERISVRPYGDRGDLS